MKRTNSKGFTLIELLVVIAIIGLLSTLAVVALNTARVKSRDAKRISDVKQVQTALELYYADKGTYPAGPVAAHLCGGNPDGFTASACGSTATDATYMGQVPSDPTNTGTSIYTYTQTGSGTGYTLTFVLEGPTGNLAAGSHTGSPNGIQ